MSVFDINYRVLDTRLDTYKKFVSGMKYRISPRNHVDKYGKSLLYLIATEGGKKKQISLNLYVNRSEWNPELSKRYPVLWCQNLLNNPLELNLPIACHLPVSDRGCQLYLYYN